MMTERYRFWWQCHYTLQQSLSLEILVGFLIHHIALAVLILFLLIWFPGLVKLLYLEFLPERHRILDLCHVGEVGSVGDTQASHTVSVPPLSKVSLESLGALVCIVSANFTIVRNIEAVEFVEPVGDGLAVPA